MKLLFFTVLSLTLTVISNPAPADPLSDALASGKNAAMLAEHARHPQYQAELRKARAAGLPTTLGEIFPKPPPPDQNAAILYIKLDNDKLYPRTQEETDAYSIIRQVPHSDAEWLAARAFLTNHADIVAMAHAAANRPLCIGPRQRKGSDPSTIVFPEFASMRRAARVLTLESLVLAHDGKPADAVRNQVLSFRVADQAASEAVLIPWLVSIAIEAIALRGMQDILLLNVNDPAIATAVERAVAKYAKSHSPVYALRTEFAWQTGEMNYMWKAGPQALVNAIGDSPPPKAPQMSPRVWNAFMDANGTYLLKLQREFIDATALPYPKASKRCAEIANRSAVPDDPRSFLATLLFPIFTALPGHSARLTADANITRAAALVFVYKSKHGVFPASLADAMPKVPTDPFDLKPLRYRRAGDGFVVYSVGETGKYDGGAFDNKKHHEVVFRWPAN